MVDKYYNLQEEMEFELISTCFVAGSLISTCINTM